MIEKKRVTIKQVAKAAGVSMQTVSRVLNNHPDVSAATFSRVQQVIDDLGYSPNAIARSLIQGHSNTLGVVGYGLELYGPAQLLTGVERQANELGYSLFLSLLRFPDAESEQKVMMSLLSRQVDGIIWAVPQIGDNRSWVSQGLSGLSVPVVFIHMQPVPGVCSISVDNLAGGKVATQHLLTRGYGRIGVIAGPMDWWESRQRVEGWRQAMKEAALKVEESWIQEGNWTASSGEAAMRRLLNEHPDLEAVFVSNDQMALGALTAAKQLGRNVPMDLGVAGFDDIPESPYFSPPLTTIRQKPFEFGMKTVQLLHRLLTEPDAAVEKGIRKATWLNPELIVRESTGHISS